MTELCGEASSPTVLPRAFEDFIESTLCGKNGMPAELFRTNSGATAFSPQPRHAGGAKYITDRFILTNKHL